MAAVGAAMSANTAVYKERRTPVKAA